MTERVAAAAEMRVRTEQSRNPRRALQIRELQGPGSRAHNDGSGARERRNRDRFGVRIPMAVGAREKQGVSPIDRASGARE